MTERSEGVSRHGEPDAHFESLLTYLKEARGFDFTGYKRSSLMRRVSRRMAQVAVPTYAEYLDYLQVHPDEFTALFNTILINVTGFFRDSENWDYLRTDVLPMVLAGKGPDTPLRVWSAGCASGEEAYSLAIMIAETLGSDAFPHRVKIYATDVDEEGLAQARSAVYTEREVGGLAPELLERYFDAGAGRYTFRKDLRRSVIFGRNDLVQDAPISRIDLLVCRNTLMYFNAETQSRILSRFHFALTPGGALFLGKAEMLLSHANLFIPIDLTRRLFRRSVVPNAVGPGLPAGNPVPDSRADPTALDRVRTEGFAASPVAQVVVTADGLVALCNRQAEALFGVSAKDVGRPFRDLDLSYRPRELRGLIERAQVDRRMTVVGDVEYLSPSGEKMHLEIQINPLVENNSRLLGVALIFLDVTGSHRLQEELEYANRQMEAAYEELQSTNEELETTNEELQSTVEELETTNEELQSTNEELETMNEELQSTNDELQAINDQLRERSVELDNANGFLATVLTSLRAGVAVVNRDLHVRVWNRRAEDLWGLRADEAVGQHFLNLDIGLPTERLRPMIRQLLADGTESFATRVAAVNRRGRPVEVQVVCTALTHEGGDPTGVILIMDPVDHTGDDGSSLGGQPVPELGQGAGEQP